MFSLEGYKFGKHLYKGGNAIVSNAVTDENPGREVVVKVCEISHHSKDRIKKEYRCSEFISKNSDSCPFIVKFIQFVWTEQYAFMVMKKYRGDLMDLINEEEFDSDRAELYALNTAKAVEFLHGLKLMHRDIKPENVLTDDTVDCFPYGDIKVCDFEYSIGTDKRRTKVCGTINYMAPELLVARSEVEYDHSVDIYSLGVLFYELVSGCSPFLDPIESKHIENIIYQSPDWTYVENYQRDIIQWIWKRERPTAAEVVKKLETLI